MSLWVGLALASTPMTSPEGLPYSWEQGTRLNFAGNPTNVVGLAHDDVRHAMVRSLQRWERASDQAIAWDYWQSEEYPTDLANDGLSTLIFASQMNPREAAKFLTFSTVAYTRLWVDADTGTILEADIVLNDTSYAFTTDPEQALYTDGWSNRTYHIEDVLVHEVGHALGLDHSGVLQSTQFTWGWPGQKSLSCDDRAAIRATYPDVRFTDDGQVTWNTVPQTGTLSGAVRDPDGHPVLGAQVVLISQQRQGVYAAGLSDASGNFSVGGLEPGTYFAYVEPFYGGAQVLTGAFRDLNPIICPDRALFSRRFLVQDDGVSLGAIDVTAGQDLSIGALTVDCSADGGAQVPGSDPHHQAAGAQVVLSGDGTASRLERLEPDGFRRWFRLEDIQGQLTLKVLSYSLYSPIWVTAELYDSAGQELPVTMEVPVLTDPVLGETVYDALLVAQDLPPGDYLVAVRAASLPPEEYPRGDLYLDTTPYAVLLFNAGQDVDVEGLLDHSLSECWEPEYFTPYVSPPGDPPGYTARGCSTAPGAGWWALGMLLATARRRRRSPARRRPIGPGRTPPRA